MLQARTVSVGLLALALCAGCGEVYADLDVRKQATAEVWLTPAAVFAGTTTWMEVRARLDGGTTADVQSHGLDGRNNVKLAYDSFDFFPGQCPAADGAIDSEAVQDAAVDDASPVGDDGEYVFCAAIEVGPFEATEVLSVPFTFWNGSETVQGTATLTINVAPGDG